MVFAKLCQSTCTCTDKYYTVLYCIAENLEGIKFGKFGVLIAICQNKIRHFEPLYACSMACGHKFAKLKFANHQNLAIRQILVPPKFPAIQYIINVHV